VKTKLVSCSVNILNVCSGNEPRLNADYKLLEKHLFDRVNQSFNNANVKEIKLFLAGTLIDEVKLIQAMLFGILKEIYISNSIRDSHDISFNVWLDAWSLKISAVSIDQGNLDEIKQKLSDKNIVVGVGWNYDGLFYELSNKEYFKKFNNCVELIRSDLLDDLHKSLFEQESYDAVICVSSLYKKTAFFADETFSYLKEGGYFLRHQPESDDLRVKERREYENLEHIKTDNPDSWLYVKSETKD